MHKGGRGWLSGAFVLSLLLAWSGCSDDADSNGETRDEDAAMETDAGHDAGSAATARAVTVTGPIDGTPLTTSTIDLDAHDYGEKEFFYAGEATAYALEGEMAEHGRWTLTEAAQKPFKSRLLVRRPRDATKFNGTVIVEWLNVSGGGDGDPGFMYNWEEILREGYVWVGVSAQITGVEGGGVSLVPGPSRALKVVQPERYGSLAHPGDAYSFDLYTRVAQILRGAGDIDVLEGLSPERIIAYGESQSAIRLVSYVDGVHPLVEAFDGFFIHSRSASAFSFGDDTSLPFGGSPVSIRDDLDEPVFQFQTETDLYGVFGFAAARQADSDRLRTWEVAGTAHADAHILSQGSAALGCGLINDGPQHFVIKAALHALQLWLKDGTLPVTGERLMVSASNTPVVDEHGNSRGGVRTPAVDVPIATLSGMPAPANASNVLCSLFGQTTPFSADTLKQLYPTHDDYVAKVEESARTARQGKFILPPEERAMVDAAKAAPVPE